MRTLLVINASHNPAARAPSAAGATPRKDYLELQRSLEADLIDNTSVEESSGARHVRRLLGRAPAQALLAWSRALNYDVIFVDGEAVGFLLAALLSLGPRRVRLVMIGHRLSAPKKQILYRGLALGRRIDGMIVHSSLQQRVAVYTLGLSPDRVSLAPYQTDQHFWSEAAQSADDAVHADAQADTSGVIPAAAMICSVGLEYRDYDTLIAALAYLPRDSSPAVVIAAASHWSAHGGIEETRPLPPGMRVGSFDYAELRALYARARFVVVPLEDVDNQAGITTILEAMSMGKAVIVSHARGQTDVVRDRRARSRRDQGRPTQPDWARRLVSSPDERAFVSGHTGIYVTPGDPVELAHAYHLSAHASRPGRVDGSTGACARRTGDGAGPLYTSCHGYRARGRLRGARIVRVRGGFPLVRVDVDAGVGADAGAPVALFLWFHRITAGRSMSRHRSRLGRAHVQHDGWWGLATRWPLACVVGYLDILAVAALAWRGPDARPTPTHSFALLIPAHDEETTLPRTLVSIAHLDYPRHLVEVHVVADNCTDQTALIAWRHGARVHVRTDTRECGKGAALGWLIDRVTGRRHDAYVVVDADTVVSANLLRVFDAHLARGDEAIQAYYGTEPGDGPMAALRDLAFALYNGVRPRGRDVLGLSAGLHGNDMCLSAALLRHVGWDVSGLAEDAELHLRLVEAGVRVRYAGGASVTALTPPDLGSAHSQHLRWERGRLQLLRADGPRLLWRGLRRRDLVLSEAMAQQVVPPFSLITAFVTASALLSLHRCGRSARRLSALTAFGHVAYVVVGLRLTDASRPNLSCARARTRVRGVEGLGIPHGGRGDWPAHALGPHGSRPRLSWSARTMMMR